MEDEEGKARAGEKAAMNEDSSPIVRLFDGVFKLPDPRNPSKQILATRNLTPGRSTYGESLVRLKFNEDIVEFRSWDPFRSKLSAAILNGLRHFHFHERSYCLYLGASTGTTISHISDIVGRVGRVFGVEVAPRVAREFLENVAKYRKNIVPIIEDAKHPERYPSIYGNTGIIYSDVAQPDQTEIAVKNSNAFLQDKGILYLVIKASSIDALKPKKEVFQEQEVLLERASFKILERIDLEPFDRNHAMIVAEH